MSQENVEIATRAKAALMPGDLDTVLKLVGRSVNARIAMDSSSRS